MLKLLQVSRPRYPQDHHRHTPATPRRLAAAPRRAGKPYSPGHERPTSQRRGGRHDHDLAATSPSTASASARCASPVTGHLGRAAGSRRGQGDAAARRRARRQLHRHRRLLRPRRQRDAHRRGAAPLPRRPRHRHQGRPRAHRARALARQRAARPPARRPARAACSGCASTRSRSTSSTGPTPTCPLEDSIGALVELQGRGQDPPHRAVATSPRPSCASAQQVTPIVSVQNRYNVTDRGSESLVDLCEQERSAFLPWAPIHDLDGDRRRARDRRASRRDADAGRARLVARPLAGDAADPRHGIGRPPRGERRGRRAASQRRRHRERSASGRSGGSRWPRTPSTTPPWPTPGS